MGSQRPSGNWLWGPTHPKMIIANPGRTRQMMLPMAPIAGGHGLDGSLSGTGARGLFAPVVRFAKKRISNGTANVKVTIETIANQKIVSFCVVINDLMIDA